MSSASFCTLLYPNQVIKKDFQIAQILWLKKEADTAMLKRSVGTTPESNS